MGRDLGGGSVIVFLLFGLASRTPYFALVRTLLAGALVLLCISDWRTKGHGWLATLSWTVPLGGLWIVGQILVDRPAVLVAVAYWLGFVTLMVMLVSVRAAMWWYRVILRRPFRS